MHWDKLEWDLSLSSGDTDTVLGKVTHRLVDFSAFVSSPVLLDDNGARSLSQELSPTVEVKNQSVSCGINIYSMLCAIPVFVASHDSLDNQRFPVKCFHSLHLKHGVVEVLRNDNRRQ